MRVWVDDDRSKRGRDVPARRFVREDVGILDGCSWHLHHFRDCKVFLFFFVSIVFFYVGVLAAVRDT
jgi:hypothetical protein